MKNLLEKYIPLVGSGEINEIISLAEELGPVKIQHVNSTKVGGGVAEILNFIVPTFKSLGIDITWDVIKGNKEFFEITKKIHNMLHGEHVPLTQKMTDRFIRTVKSNLKIIHEDADIIVINDPQPLPLIERKGDTHAKWVWRCHIDATKADYRLTGFLRQFIDRYDCSVYHLPNYAFGSFNDEYIMAPAIDPFNDKNKELTTEQIKHELNRYNIDPSIPILIQVSRYDKFKDPIGVIEAFKMVQDTGLHAQLILAGGTASDDPEGARILKKVIKKAKDNPSIHILQSPPDITINALQRAASVVIQKSLREGFGLVVTEAMWKGKAVVGGNVGGIRRQIIHGETGFLVDTIEGTAYRIQQLLSNPVMAKQMGNAAKQSVLTNYLMPSLVKHWLLLFLSIKHKKSKGVVHL